MKVLPEALRPMAAYNQFVLWIAQERRSGGAVVYDTATGRPKYDKITIDPKTGRKADAHDPTIWLDADTAISLAGVHGCGVGFTFTADDPFFFIDIDGAFDGEKWSDRAAQLCQEFKNCAVEVSMSGSGLHIFGAGKPATAPQRTKALDGSFDLFFTKRFVALTGTGIRGTAAAPGPLDSLITRYLTPQGVEGAGPSQIAEWTDGPAPEWRGPEDDEALIEKALNSVSAGSAFGDRASFRDLWEVNEDALGRIYPDPQRAFDHSRADSALCQHLAFWTGRDCERIDRIFRQSGLYREKWENREDYRRETILRTVTLCRNVYSAGGDRAESDEEAAIASGVFMTVPQQIELFKGHVYIADHNAVLTPSGRLYKPEMFRAWYGGYLFERDLDGHAKPTDDAWKAFTGCRGHRFPRAHTICFRPDREPGELIEEEGLTAVNIYVPISTPCHPGDPAPFIEHLRKLLPNEIDRIILVSYLAACIQYKGVKFSWTPVLQGTPGNGKSVILRMMRTAIGRRYCHAPNSSDLGNKFNKWVTWSIFAGVDEMTMEKREEVFETLKSLIADIDIEIQGKGADQTMGQNICNFVICTNYHNGVRKTANDRRLCVMFTGQQSKADLLRDGMDEAYFDRLFAWLNGGGYAIVHHYLKYYQIPAQYNPAGRCRWAPTTSTTERAMAASMGPIEQEIIEAVEEGRAGMMNGWISSVALDEVLSRNRRASMISWQKRREILEALGYVKHPGLPGGRATTILSPGTSRPMLYVKNGHKHQWLTDPAEVAAAYSRDQGYI